MSNNIWEKQKNQLFLYLHFGGAYNKIDTIHSREATGKVCRCFEQ